MHKLPVVRFSPQIKSLKLYSRMFLLCAIAVNTVVSAQELKWRTLPNGPFFGGQFQDISFINSKTGWLGGAGIYRTTDGGFSWITQSNFATGGIGGRSVLFLDSMLGFSGQFMATGGRTILYRTTNGGFNWNAAELPFTVTSQGVCGLFAAGGHVIYGCGRWGGPATILKSTNAGNSWDTLSIGGKADGLIDLHFFSPDSGFVFGGTGDFQSGSVRPVVLFTSNGGINWITVYTGSRTNEWCWKAYFTSRDTGFASVERFDNNSIFIKTINAGQSWTEIPAPSFDMEGIGFLDFNTGWVGGQIAYKTTNCGLSWTPDSLLQGINRFRFLSDSLGFAAGVRVHKYSRDSIIGVVSLSNEVSEEYRLSQNFPNPFNPVTKIRFYLPFAHTKHVKITVYDAVGREIAVLVDELLLPGGYEIEWNASAYPSGVYFYSLEAGDYRETKKMALIK